MLRVAIFLLGLIFVQGAAQAACTSPVGAEGAIIYNTDYHTPQYCNGTIWMAFSETVAGGGGGGCTSPTGREGQLVYNNTYHVMQFCNGTAWVKAGTGTATVGFTCSSTGGCPNVGDVCADGTQFVGCTFDSGVAIYTTRCRPGRSYSGGVCSGTALTTSYGDGTANTPLTTATDAFNGQINSAILVATDANTVTGGFQKHKAADYCDTLSIHSQTDWYLPALYEIVLLAFNNAYMTDGSTANPFISSTDSTATSFWSKSFSNQQINVANKSSNVAYRCVRRN